MIKLISFIVFIAAFATTWQLFNNSIEPKIQVHASLQSKLSALIESTIKINDPHVADFKINQIYTENTGVNEIKAHFKYEFSTTLENGEITRQMLAGEALLSKKTTVGTANEDWSINQIKTTTNQISYQQGLLIDTTKESSDTTTVTN